MSQIVQPKFVRPNQIASQSEEKDTDMTLADQSDNPPVSQSSTQSSSQLSSQSSNHLHPHSHPHPHARTPPPPAATPPPPSNTCTHYQSLNLSTLHARFRTQSFLDSLQSINQPLNCSDCHRAINRKDLWVCLNCPSGCQVRCGRGTQSVNASGESCSFEHAQSKKHGLVMNITTRLIWCYFDDSEIIDDIGRVKGQPVDQSIKPQAIRHCIDASDPAEDSDEDRMNDQSMDQSMKDAEEDNMTWIDYYENNKGGDVGLSNLGNTCFMNAALQALIHCPPLVAFLSEMSHIPLNDIRQRLIADFSALLQKAWSGNYSLVVPGELYRDIVFINPYFRGYGQHDSQELMRVLLDQMHEGLKVCEQYSYLYYVFGQGTGEEQEARRLEHEAEKQRERDLQASLKQNDKSTRSGKKEKKRKNEPQQSTNLSTTQSSSSNNLSHQSTTNSSSSPSPSASPSPSPQPSQPAKKPMKHWPEHSVISDTFMGLLESRIRCHQCGTLSTVHDQFYDLSLEIPKEANMKRIAAERGTDAMTPTTKQSWFGSLLTYAGLVPAPLSLETCLHAFCTSDRLIASDQYRCEKCAVKVDASKTLSVYQLPEVLTLHIKRFAHNAYFGSKLNRHVHFPINGLDMSPFMSSEARRSSDSAVDCIYDLFGLVRHLGGAGGGHYIAYCKNHVTGKWYEFDDRVVTEISEKRLSEIEAYVLFYRRRHSAPPTKQLLQHINDAKLVNQPTPLPPNTPVRFLSREYVKRVVVLGRVEPIDNRDLLCVHGIPYDLPSDGSSLAHPITLAGWEKLIALYGGGPAVDGKHYECAACLLPAIRAREKKRISALDVEASQNSPASDPFYLIEHSWLNEWRTFVMGGDHRPGPINNHALLDEHGKPREGLQKLKDYRGLHGTVWDELVKCYGGGPAIVRAKLDIYDEPYHPNSANQSSNQSINQSINPAHTTDEKNHSDDDDMTDEISQVNVSFHNEISSPTNQSIESDPVKSNDEVKRVEPV